MHRVGRSKLTTSKRFSILLGGAGGLMLCLCLSAVSASVSAWAQDAGGLDAGVADVEVLLEARQVQVDGEEGVWLPMERARRVLMEVLTGRRLKDLLEAVEQRLAVEKRRSGVLTRERAGLRGEVYTWQKEGKACLAQLQRRQAWYWSPFLWGAVAFGLGVGTTILVVDAVN